MRALVNDLKECGQDFEFYPTTNEIIDRLVADLDRDRYRRGDSVLDIGAGSGKVLQAIKERTDYRDLYAIEKSPLLCGRLPKEVFILGTAFEEQSLIDKRVDLIFCNPPYSTFVEWAEKIIRESAASLVYLVLPTRWAESDRIREAVKFRDGKTKVIGTFSFEDAEDRQARATVNLIRVDLPDEKDDAFNRFFDEQFADVRANFEWADKVGQDPAEPKAFRELVVGPTYPEKLVNLYDAEMEKVRRNYTLVGELDVALLKEFEVTPARILECLKARLRGLRNVYWQELFSHMHAVTDRLTSKKRRQMLAKLSANGHVDFTLSNIHAIILWVLRQANDGIDEQLIETFETMLDKANVRNYKSNQRPFVYDQWRYNQEKPTHVALEYRIVVTRVGGIQRGYSFERGLAERAAEFIQDLLTVARNLGFFCNTVDHRLDRTGRDVWKSGTVHVFDATVNGKEIPLLEVRAYLNGNLHVRLHQKFAAALNVEYGRLKGWLKSGAEAAEELGEPMAAAYFHANVQLGTESLLMLGDPQPVAEAA